MNQREQTKLHVLNSVLEYQVPIDQAAELLGVTQRHARRMLAAYRKDGAATLAHGNRGRGPHNAIPAAEAAAVVELASQRYEGANHTHLTELLREREGIDLSRPTVRRILTQAGIGSRHAWREDRGPKFVLLLAVDDATGVVSNAVFRTRGYSGLLHAAGGLDRRLEHTPWRCTATTTPCSSTTPAKGRLLRKPLSSPVPCRNWGSGRSSPALSRPRAGWNAWRKPSRIAWSPSCAWLTPEPSIRPPPCCETSCLRFNARFAVQAKYPEPAYRPVAPDLRRSETLCFKDTRKVALDNTVKYHWRVLQLLPDQERPSYAGLCVEVLERPDGEVIIKYEGRTVATQEPPPRMGARWASVSPWSPGPELKRIGGSVGDYDIGKSQQ